MSCSVQCPCCLPLRKGRDVLQLHIIIIIGVNQNEWSGLVFSRLKFCRWYRGQLANVVFGKTWTSTLWSIKDRCSSLTYYHYHQSKLNWMVGTRIFKVEICRWYRGQHVNAGLGKTSTLTLWCIRAGWSSVTYYHNHRKWLNWMVESHIFKVEICRWYRGQLANAGLGKTWTWTLWSIWCRRRETRAFRCYSHLVGTESLCWGTQARCSEQTDRPGGVPSRGRIHNRQTRHERPRRPRSGNASMDADMDLRCCSLGTQFSSHSCVGEDADP